jgi:aconitate hydratase
MANLCNYGILPLVFANPDDYNSLNPGAAIFYREIRSHVMSGVVDLPVEVDGRQIRVFLHVSQRMRRMLLEGGALNMVKTGSF